MNQEQQCRHLLSKFFHEVKGLPARWLPIISYRGPHNRSSSSSKKQKKGGEDFCDATDNSFDCLSDLMGLNYSELYIPFMQRCGLIDIKKSNRWGSTNAIPCIAFGNKFNTNYSWEEFIAEYRLCSSIMQLSYTFDKQGRKQHYVLIGSFRKAPFTIREQMADASLVISRPNGTRNIQKSLVESLAVVLPWIIPPSLPTLEPQCIDNNVFIEEFDSPPSQNFDSDQINKESLDDEYSNLKNVLQLQLFDKILKPGIDCSILWNMIDATKLQVGLEGVFKSMQQWREESRGRNLSLTESASSTRSLQIELGDGKNINDFPALKSYGIPLVTTAIHSVLRDIVALSRKAKNVDLLTFPLFNRADVSCTLVNIPSSFTYDRFKRNANRTGWVKRILLSASREEEGEVAARWILQYLGDMFNDCFADIACRLGLLLPAKVMDAETASAMWEEGNVPLRAQRIILRHLKAFFGRRITVPESKIRELENGALPPITDSNEIDNNTIHFWYKKIDEVICHRIKTELKYRGQDFFAKNGYDSLDIVLGGDHGARRFRAELRLIFRNSRNMHINPYSTTLCVGSIDCTKDTRDILDKTIGSHLNDGLHRIVNKYLVAHSTLVNNNEYCNVVIFAEEPPAAANSEHNFTFETRTFVSGDMAFFAVALGKENMSTAWCTWCKLSKLQWSAVGHEVGEPWTIEGINNIRDSVEINNMREIPENIKGCTMRPLFDAVPVSNYILCMLHIIIGVGNTLIGSLLEWVEERVEKLTADEISMRNSVLYAEVQHAVVEKEYNDWLQNCGVLLVDKQLESQSVAIMLASKVCACLFIYFFSSNIKYNIFVYYSF